MILLNRVHEKHACLIRKLNHVKRSRKPLKSMFYCLKKSWEVLHRGFQPFFCRIRNPQLRERTNLLASSFKLHAVHMFRFGARSRHTKRAHEFASYVITIFSVKINKIKIKMLFAGREVRIERGLWPPRSLCKISDTVFLKADLTAGK